MFRNFFIITFRSIATHRIYSFINVLGLAVGMASALLISIFIHHELIFDRSFTDANRIYRVTIDGQLKGKDLNMAVTAPPMAKTLAAEYPEVESATRIARFGAWLVSKDDAKYNEDNFLFADSNFFDLFSYEFIDGNADSALRLPRSIVLTQSTAKKYFGDKNPVGQFLRIETDTNLYKVTGLLKDLPGNSHLSFEMLGSLKTFDKYLQDIWVSHSVYTYVRLKEGTHIAQLEQDINKLVSKYVGPQVEDYLGIPLESFSQGEHTLRYHLQPIVKIHLHSHLDVELQPNGNALYVYTFGAIALLILVIASLNFMNLATANSVSRAREVILRKVIGSERKMLIIQFLTESVVFSFLALLLAFFLAELAMPEFNKYLNIDLQFDGLKNLPAILSILSFTLLIGLFTGSYPAYLISSYKPVDVINGNLKTGNKGRKLRSAFIVFQFFASILIIILSLVVYAQVDFMLNKDLGFKKERMLVVRRPDALKEKITDFKKEILRYPNIEAVTNSNSIPGRDFWTSTFIFESDSTTVNLLMNQIFVNPDFREAFSLQMLDGRFFSSSILSDSAACVINETAAKEINQAQIIGSTLLMPGFMKKTGKQLKIIGVVKDFHFESVDKEIQPLVISLMPGNWEGYLEVRLSSTDIDKTIKFLEQSWQKYTSDYPFQYFFLDQDYDRNYHSVIGIGKVLFIFALLSVFMACLGLFGLVSFSSKQRTHEIAIRKSMGANYLLVLLMLLKETAILLLIATLFAWSVAYLFSKLWLNEFYSRINLTPIYFIKASLIVFALSLLVVIFQYLKMARRNPGNSLRLE